MKRAAQRVVIRRFVHADFATPLRRIMQQRFDLTITFTLMLPDNQAGEQLRQREVVATELAGVLWQRVACEKEGRTHRLPWRFAGQHYASSTRLAESARPVKSVEEGGLRQSHSVPVVRTFFKTDSVPVVRTRPRCSHGPVQCSVGLSGFRPDAI